MGRRVRRGLGAVALSAFLLTGGPAWSADGTSISHAEPTDGGLQILVSVPADAAVDLADVTVTIGGEPVEATAEQASGNTVVRRTTILVIDTSNSMKGNRFAAAKVAASAYLDAVPDDVEVGIVTFDSDIDNALLPTTDRTAAQAVIDGLSLSRKTRLYDGVIAAVEMAGEEGQRTLLVLSDGADTSKTDLADATAAIENSEILLDVVSLEQSGANAPLTALAGAGQGQVIQNDSAALAATFADEAEVLARQVLVTAQVPASVEATEAEVAITLASGSGPLTANAFLPIRLDGSTPDDAPTGVVPTEGDHGLQLPNWVMYAGVGLLGAGLLGVLAMLLTGLVRGPMTAEQRVAKFAASSRRRESVPRDRDQALAQATQAAAGVLEHNESLELRIAKRLEGAGSELKPAEWLLLHMGIVIGAGLLGLLLGGGNLFLGLVFIAAGVVLPWLYLGFKRGSRVKAFNASLPDTLQLMSGSLAAGLSLAQSVDTIVREGTEPIASEFKRVLIETRLGVALEDALEGVTDRFQSKDFEWVVMAIKIQRQVGGNLGELLNTVAATIREREYLRRQVATLSAEGKMSAWVLGLLPPLFLVYLSFSQRDYVMPMFTEPMGWVMLAGAGLLLSVGVFWMSRLVKVDV